MEQNIIQISTEGESWWVNELSLNGKLLNIDGIDTTKENFIIEETNFSVERKNAKEIHISLKENQTELKRVLLVGLQAGNYFETIRITQLEN